MIKTTDWTEYSQALAFVGNSLLQPPTQTGAAALLPEFWGAFPTFEDESVIEAVADMGAFAQDEKDPHRVAVEFTHLFVGPPKPAVNPWETAYEEGFNGTGFGQATYEMRTLLSKEGLAVGGESNQYADHVGIELLYASMLAEKIATGTAEADEMGSFYESRLNNWLSRFANAVADEAPEGFYARMSALACALVKAFG